MTATKLLADNGVTSGITGYQLTGGDDGTLQLQTTTAGGTATTALTINNSQNVGIGTSSPNARLEISSTGASGRILLNGADLPMITNGFDKFTSGAYSGAGRWGMFMEASQLTMGCASSWSFTFKHFNADSTSTERARLRRMAVSNALSVPLLKRCDSRASEV